MNTCFRHAYLNSFAVMQVYFEGVYTMYTVCRTACMLKENIAEHFVVINRYFCSWINIYIKTQLCTI